MSSEYSLTLPEKQENPTRQLSSFNTICNLCSVGCTLEVKHENESILSVSGNKGLINSNAEYCELPETGYKLRNEIERINTPLVRKGNEFLPVSWTEAFNLIYEHIVTGDPSSKAFFAGARLTNEEQFLIMKLCRAGAYSNDIGSFHYLGRGTGYTKLSRANIPFAELIEAKRVYIIGSELNRDNPVAGQLIFNNQKELGIPVCFITENNTSQQISLASSSLVIKSYFHFLKAVNYYLVVNELEDKDYIKNLVENFEEYKQALLKSDYKQLCGLAGADTGIIENFANEYRNEPHAVLVFSENELSGHTCGEVFNLAMLAGKHGRTGAGLLLLKENNNSHGLHDMGVMWNIGPGATPWDDPFQRSTVEFTWRSKDLPTERGYTLHKFRESGYESLFIFGEDPVGCAINPEEIKSFIGKSKFILVQDYFMTPTAEMATIILPATYPFETGGTFTNSQRVIQKVDKRLNSPLEIVSWRQLEELLARCGYERYESVDDITFEIAALLPKFCTSSKLLFRINEEDNYNPMFLSGCDAILNLARKA